MVCAVRPAAPGSSSRMTRASSARRMTAPVRAGTVGPAMDRIHRALHRLRTADQQRRDVALAVVLGVAMAIELAFTASMRNPGITFPLVAVFVAPVAFRTRAPIPALVGTWSVLVLGAAAGASLDESFVAFLTGVLLVWTVAARTERLRVVLAADAYCFAALISIVAFESSVGISDVLWSSVMVIVLPTVGARLVHSSGRLSDLLAERARSLELEQDERARLAAARERERIAAELHDVVAHGVSAMVIQAAAARRIITTGGDPDLGPDAIAEVEASGRAALDELRRLLGVLRRGDEALALAPQPSLARVDRLVARMRDEGLPVELEVDGRPGGLPAGAGGTPDPDGRGGRGGGPPVRGGPAACRRGSTSPRTGSSRRRWARSCGSTAPCRRGSASATGRASSSSRSSTTAARAARPRRRTTGSACASASRCSAAASTPGAGAAAAGR